MMKFLQFCCLAVNQKIYSFSLEECCPTLPGFLCPILLWMLLHSCQVWVGSTGSSPWPTVRACWGLMWTHMYEKQMGIDWEKTLPSGIHAPLHTKATVHHPCISKKTSSCRAWFTWTLWFGSEQQSKRSTGIFLTYALGISQSQHRHNSLYCLGQKHPCALPPSVHFVGLISDSLQLSNFSRCCCQMHTKQHVTVAVFSPPLCLLERKNIFYPIGCVVLALKCVSVVQINYSLLQL